MRLVRINAPEGKGETVAQTAFAVGIESVSVFQVEQIAQSGARQTKDVVDLQTSTPKAKLFLDALLSADYYDAQDYAVLIRAPRSVLSKESLFEITKPLPETAADILEELFQFAHITYGFVGRVFIAGGLLAYGLIEQQMLIMIAGLLFLPLLPLLQAVGFGALTGHAKLSAQGALAFALAAVLLVAAGAATAAFSDPPLRYNEFNSIFTGFLISLGVGVAAGLAIIDDAGRREMIGLAATAQIAILPVWLGICLVFGFPATMTTSDVLKHIVSFFINFATIIAAAGAVHYLTGAASRSLARFRNQ